MKNRYNDRDIYFNEQADTTRRFVIPYINTVKKIDNNSRILEVGCGDGGNLLPFAEIGCVMVAVEIEEFRCNLAKENFNKLQLSSKPEIIHENIYNVSSASIGLFDLVILRDVIEHIPEQEKVMLHLKTFLKEDGVIFFGFPPWQMPFGGHQQVAVNKYLKKLPYFHLLPMPLFKSLLRIAKEPPHKVAEFIELKETGISIERFTKIVKDSGMKIIKKTLYAINPNYEVKFGLKQREQLPILKDVPYIRNYFTTCMYAIVGK